MKKFTFIVFVLSVLTVAVLIFVPEQHFKPASEANYSDQTTLAAKQALQQYIDAVKSGNVAKMMKYSSDTRYRNDENRRKADYTQLVKHHPIQDIQINQLEKVDDNLVMVSIDSFDTDGTHQLVTIPIYKMVGEWKVVVGGEVSAPLKTPNN